jgi:DNA-binding response OmpR family regulator
MTATNILVVEDEKDLADIYRRVLTRYGAEVVECPFEALDRLKTNKYNLILTDGTMPGMHGSELIQKAKESGYSGEILMVTGDRYIKNNGVDVIQKPFKIKALLSTIDTLLEK